MMDPPGPSTTPAVINNAEHNVNEDPTDFKKFNFIFLFEPKALI